MKKDKIRLTDYNTIKGNNFEEISVDEFFEKIERNLNNDSYGVLYDKKHDNFVVTFDGKNYILKLNDYIMLDYKKGKYDCFTKRLNKILENQPKMFLETSIEDENERKEKLLKEAIDGNIVNEEAKILYINYLKQELKFDLKKYFKNLADDFIDKKNNKLEKVVETYDKLFEKLSDMDISFTRGFITFLVFHLIFRTKFIVSFILNIISIFAPFSIALVLLGTFIAIICPINFILNRIERHKENIKTRRLIKSKIEVLSKNNYDLTQSKSISSEILEHNLNYDSTRRNNLKDAVLDEIDAVLEALNYIDKENALILAQKLQKIMNDYKKEKDTIEPTDALNLLSLKKVYISKVQEIILELTKIQKRIVEQQISMTEEKIVERKLSNLINKEKNTNAEKVLKRMTN